MSTSIHGTNHLKAVALIKRPNLRTLAKQLLRERGFDVLASADTFEAVSEALGRHKDALLLLDYDIDLGEINRTLKLAGNSDSARCRPILLLAQQMNDSLLAVASDYHVTRIATGDITVKSLGDDIDQITQDTTDPLGVAKKLVEATVLRKRGDHRLAGEILTELQAKYPDHPKVNCDLIDHLIRLEKWDEASAVIDTVKISYGSSTRLMQLKARVHLHRGETDEATNLLEQSNLLNPYFVERLVDLGHLLLLSHKYDAALTYFNQALELEPQHTSAKHGKVTCHLLSNELNEALSLLRDASSPREIASLFNNAAVLAIRSDRFEHSLKLYETAISVLGRNDKVVAKLVFNLGLAYLKNHHARKALPCFRLAHQIDTQFKKAKHYLDLVSKFDDISHESVTHL